MCVKLEVMSDQTLRAPVSCASLAETPISAENAVTLARVFKAVGDPVRLRLLSLIASRDGETCVCDLTAPFDVTAPTISHHLKVLREAGLIDCERRGTWVYYWARPESMAQLSRILAPGARV
jgi:ArsR family transcriptional regulator, arsenate/arsenite/antimonite-responsive transcriptional repressor